MAPALRILFGGCPTTIREAVDIPVLVDAETGFGNALNVRHCVRVLERAGANAIQIEDQTMPKRCGHFSSKSVIPVEEMIGKIKAAVDARSSADLLIIARTDAVAVDGFEPAIERVQRYIEAGADVTFVEAPERADDIRKIPQRLSVPQVINIVVGGKTPVFAQEVAGMQAALKQLKTSGRMDESSVPQSGIASFAERQRLVKKPLFDELDGKYAGGKDADLERSVDKI